MSDLQSIRLGTRGSQLALYQAHTVARLLKDAGAPRCEIVVIKTTGDLLQTQTLSEIGGKRLFVKEIEDALLDDEIDIAVHSSKDMPAVLPAGLAVAGVLPREDPHDVVVLPRSAAGSGQPAAQTIEELIAMLGPSPSIGTSSVRRVAQLSRLLPDARFTPIRGNLDTRLRKLDEGSHGALVLAAAGLRRLGFESRISFTLPVSACVPAPGQGIIAIEMRTVDNRVRQALGAITDSTAEAALAAERSLVETLGGGCQTPIGALATPFGADDFELVATVVSVRGDRAVRASATGPRSQAVELGKRVAYQLIDDGANEILEETRRTTP